MSEPTNETRGDVVGSIVLVALAIFAPAVILFVFFRAIEGLTDYARDEVPFDEAQVVRQVELFRTVCGRYPSPREGLGVIGSTATGCTAWRPQRYFSINDAYGRPYGFAIMDTQGEVRSAGNDGLLFTDDDIVRVFPRR